MTRIKDEIRIERIKYLFGQSNYRNDIPMLNNFAILITSGPTPHIFIYVYLS